VAEGAKRQTLLLWRLLRAQAPLLPKGIWIPSAAALLLAFLIVSLWSGASSLPSLLSLVIPLVTATSLTLIYGPEQDPGLELALATPTSPRLVLACRLVLVYGYNTLLALGITLLLTLSRGAPFSLVASVWLGPMLLLGGASLLLSVVAGAVVGSGAAVGVALLRLLMASLDAPSSQISIGAWQVDALWQTNPTVLVLAALAIALAVLLVSREPRLVEDFS